MFEFGGRHSIGLFFSDDGITRCPLGFSQNAFQLLDNLFLPRLDLLHGRFQIKEFRPINFRKFHLLVGVWRPFHREGVAFDGFRIAIPFKRLGVNNLAVSLLDQSFGAFLLMNFQDEHIMQITSQPLS
jgi:hypothetical protein